MISLLVRHVGDANPTEDLGSCRVEFLLVDSADEHNRREGACLLLELPERMGELEEGAPHRTIVLIPDEWTLSLSVSIPGRNTKAISQAVPFAVEPFLAGDLDSNHVAHGEIRRGELVECLVVEHQVLQGVLATYAALDLSPSVVTCRTSLVERRPDTVSLFCDGEECIVKTAEDGLCVQRGELRELLSDHFEQHVDATRRVLVRASPDDELAELEGASSDVEIAVERLHQGALGEMLRWALLPGSVNLLQRRYEREEISDFEWRRWAVPASLAATWIVLSVCVLTGQGIWAEMQSRDLIERSEGIYQEIYGEPSRSEDPGLRMVQRLNGAGGVPAGDRTFLGLYGNFLLANSASGAELRVVTLNFSEQSLELLLTCLSDGSADLEALEDAVAGKGARLEVVSQRVTESDARLNLRVTPLL